MNDEKSLTLNDFTSFDHLIFSDTELSKSERGRSEELAYWRDWAGEHCNNEGLTLFLPIDHYPRTIEEYQFCHYVMWMTIWALELYRKPICRLHNGARMNVESLCFACSYSSDHRKKFCPIKDWRPCCCSGDGVEYARWAFNMELEAAYEIAHLKWTKEGEEDEI